MEEEQVKKKGFWKKLQESKWKQMLFFVIGMTLLVGIFLPVNNHLRIKSEKNILEEVNVSTDFDIWFGLDKAQKQEDGIEISGWLLRKNSKISRVRLILNATDGSAAEVYFAKNGKRAEAEQRFEVDWESGNSGFSVIVPTEEIKEDTSYEVQLVLYYDKKVETEEGYETEEAYNKIRTGQYLYNGELYRYDPVAFYEPKVEDEELQTVIDEGILRAYDLEYQIWIYQYGQKIYHIWNPNNCLIKDLQTAIMVSAQTNQQELLPERRIQHGFDYLGVYHADDAYKRVGIIPYQVVVITLSEKYFTTYLVTGLYDVINEKRIKRVSIPMM